MELYKFGARYYNASYATWTQLDPSGRNAGYLFAGDDPVNQEDPSGTFSFGELAAYAGYSCLGTVATIGATGLVASLFTGGVALAAAAAAAGPGCIAGAEGGAFAYLVTGQADYSNPLDPSASRDLLTKIFGEQ